MYDKIHYKLKKKKKEEDGVIILTSQWGKLRLREVKYLAKVHS